MKYNLSSKLSPQAKKAILQMPQASVLAMAEYDENSSVQTAILQLGGTLRASIDPKLLTFEIKAMLLEQVADLDGISYVAVAEPMS